MVNKAPTVERDDDDDDGPLFFKDGRPVNFCFHESVTQGRSQITRDVERHGGQIVRNERHANVLLVDEQQDLALIRRRYYNSNEPYRLSIYVEPRRFVKACICSGTYHHVQPRREGMPGRAPGGGGRRGRVPFTEEDRDRLAQYLATRFPTRDGRMGNSAYKDLVRMGQTDDPSWAWARQHTFHSWREHYKMNPIMMDARIDYYLNRLKDVGHHHGHDPRSHARLVGKGDEEEEEEGEGEEEEEEEEEAERQDRERRERERPGAAHGRARDHIAGNEKREEEESDSMQEEEEEDEEEAIQDLQRHKRHAQHRRNVQQAKRPRVSEASSDDRPASNVEAGPGESSPVAKKESDYEESQEIEGSDLFGDRTYEDELRFEPDDSHEIYFPMRFSPRASSVPGQDGAPLSTQATLVASPHAADKEPTSAPGHTPTKVIEQAVLAPQPTAPPSSQRTLVMTQERVVVQRARVRGASAQPGPSVPKETRTRGGVVAVEAPFRNTRARSRSVDVQPAPESQRTRQERGKGKAKAKEKEKEVLVSIEEDVVVEEPMPKEVYVEDDVGRVSVTNMLLTRSTIDDEMAVEGLLETGGVRSEGGENGEDAGSEVSVDVREEAEAEDDGKSVGDEEEEVEEEEEDIVDEDGNVIPGLPRYQVVDVDTPTDSDDAETHGSLVRGAVREGTVGGDDSDAASGRSEELHDREGVRGRDQAQEQVQDRNEVQESDEDDANADADRIERMARGSLHAQRASVEPRITRSMAATQARRASPHQTRSGNQLRPSQGTKVHAPPVGNRATKAVKGRGKRT